MKNRKRGEIIKRAFVNKKTKKRLKSETIVEISVNNETYIGSEFILPPTGAYQRPKAPVCNRYRAYDGSWPHYKSTLLQGGFKHILIPDLVTNAAFWFKDENEDKWVYDGTNPSGESFRKFEQLLSHVADSGATPFFIFQRFYAPFFKNIFSQKGDIKEIIGKIKNFLVDLMLLDFPESVSESGPVVEGGVYFPERGNLLESEIRGRVRIRERPSFPREIDFYGKIEPFPKWLKNLHARSGAYMDLVSDMEILLDFFKGKLNEEYYNQWESFIKPVKENIPLFPRPEIEKMDFCSIPDPEERRSAVRTLVEEMVDKEKLAQLVMDCWYAHPPLLGKTLDWEKPVRNFCLHLAQRMASFYENKRIELYFEFGGENPEGPYILLEHCRRQPQEVFGFLFDHWVGKAFAFWLLAQLAAQIKSNRVKEWHTPFQKTYGELFFMGLFAPIYGWDMSDDELFSRLRLNNFSNLNQFLDVFKNFRTGNKVNDWLKEQIRSMAQWQVVGRRAIKEGFRGSGITVKTGGPGSYAKKYSLYSGESFPGETRMEDYLKECRSETDFVSNHHYGNFGQLEIGSLLNVGTENGAMLIWAYKDYTYHGEPYSAGDHLVAGWTLHALFDAGLDLFSPLQYYGEKHLEAINEYPEWFNYLNSYGELPRPEVYRDSVLDREATKPPSGVEQFPVQTAGLQVHALTKIFRSPPNTPSDLNIRKTKTTIPRNNFLKGVSFQSKTNSDFGGFILYNYYGNLINTNENTNYGIGGRTLDENGNIIPPPNGDYEIKLEVTFPRLLSPTVTEKTWYIQQFYIDECTHNPVRVTNRIKEEYTDEDSEEDVWRRFIDIREKGMLHQKLVHEPILTETIYYGTSERERTREIVLKPISHEKDYEGNIRTVENREWQNDLEHLNGLAIPYRKNLFESNSAVKKGLRKQGSVFIFWDSSPPRLAVGGEKTRYDDPWSISKVYEFNIKNVAQGLRPQQGFNHTYEIDIKNNGGGILCWHALFKDKDPELENWFYLWRNSGVCGRGQTDKIIFTIWPNNLSLNVRRKTVIFYIVHPFKVHPTINTNAHAYDDWKDSPNCIEAVEVRINVDCRRLR